MDHFMQSGRIGVSASLALIASLVTGSLSTPSANAQEARMAFTSRIGGEGPGSSKIARASVAKYEELLDLSDDMRVAVAALYDGYDAAYGQAAQSRRKTIEAARANLEEDSHPGPEFFQQMSAAQRTFAEEGAKLEAAFFADVKSLLTEREVQDNWPAVERLRRREVQMRNSLVSGEGVDLVAIVQSMKVAPSVRALPAELGAAVLEYELELDRKLEAKERESAAASPLEMGAGGIDLEAMRKQMAASKEMANSIKDLNGRHARKIAAVLPEDRRDEFEKLVRLKTYPRVYRDSKASRAAKVALELSDLGESKKAALREALSRYERDAAAVNEAWARAIEDQEKGEGEGAIAAAGGAVFRMSTGDEPKALTEARQARRELDKRLREAVDGELTPEQAEAVTKSVESVQESDGEHEGVMMEAVQLRIGGPG